VVVVVVSQNQNRSIYSEETSFEKKLKIHDLDAYFWQLLLVDKQKVPYLYKTTSKEFEFLHESYATAVAMATMTFQDGGYFGFKVI
jgi:hypothetical protein